MEIVLAILLLFGGFTLGSISADEANDDTLSTVTRSNADDVFDSHQITQAMHRRDLTRCDSDRTIIYRDLTVPYSSQSTSRVGNCEVNCPNE